MAKSDATNTSSEASFPTLKGYERRAVILKSEGKTNEQITNHINDEYAQNYAVRSVQTWFVPGGRLEQALTELNEALAEQSLREARQLIKRATRAASANIISHINNPDARISLDASKALLNKYIPDRQVSLSGEHKEDELPPELALTADDLIGGDDGSDPVDQPPQGGPDSPEAGA